MLNRFRLWIRSNLLRRRLEREMREEMANHLDRSTARLIARGMTPEEARRQATREFGNLPYLQEEARYARGTIWLDALAADTRFALRHFARKPGTTIVMSIVLAVGMSISTLLFSYVQSYAVQPPPGIPADDDLVRIRGSRAAGVERGSRGFSEDEFLAYRNLTDHFAAVAGWTFASVVVDAGDDTERRGLDARATFVTDNYFSVLGVRPLLGPGLPARGSDDPAMAAVALIGHMTWDQLFGRSPDVIGSTVAVNGVPVTVVGVAPERFNGVAGYRSVQLWLPLAARRLVMPEAPGELRAAGRLRPGVGTQAATVAVQVVAARTAASLEEVRALDASTDVAPLLAANGDPMFDRDIWLLSFSVGLLALLVLLVTCTNVSALLTGLAAARRQEIAVRLSLGAARSRIIRQLLTESALLASVAAAAALGIVWLVLRATAALIVELPMEVGITWQATSVTFGVALAVGILFGLSPALHATRLAIATAMRDSSGNIAATRARLQRGLVIAQIAFTQPIVVLLAAVLVFVLSHYQPIRTDFADRLVTVGIRASLPAGASTRAEADLRQQMHVATHRLFDRLSATAGVEAAVIAWGGTSALGSYAVAPEDRVPGAIHDAVRLSGQRAAEGYFRLRGIPLLRGRELTQDDAGATAPATTDVAIILGADLARRLWPGADPRGRRLLASSDTAADTPTLVVVGVVDDPLAETRDARDDYRIWLPPDPGGAPGAVLVRTAGVAQPLLPTLRKVVQDEVPDMVATVRTIAEVEDENRRRFRIITGGFMAAGLMALLLSAIGLYAVVAFSVGQRTREIAVRIAVGARGRQVAARFLADGLRLTAFGLALGLPVSLITLHALLTWMADDSLSVGLAPVAAIAALGVIVVAAAAVWIPARRAVGVDPAVTLRSE